jgi:hypothetical protein
VQQGGLQFLALGKQAGQLNFRHEGESTTRIFRDIGQPTGATSDR